MTRPILSIWDSLADLTKLNTCHLLTKSSFWPKTRSPKRAPGTSCGLPVATSANYKSKNPKVGLLRVPLPRSPRQFLEPTALRKKISWTSRGERAIFPSTVSPLARCSAERADSVRSILLWKRELSMAGRFLGFMRFLFYCLGSLAIHSPILVRISWQGLIPLCYDVLPGFTFWAHRSDGYPWVGIHNIRINW